jgi:hypothetical protein
MKSVKALSVPTDTADILMDMSGSSGEEEVPKRRGKHRRRQKKSGRDGCREPEEFQGLTEPGETQVRLCTRDSAVEGLMTLILYSEAMRKYKFITKETNDLFLCIISAYIHLKIDSGFTMSLCL